MGSCVGTFGTFGPKGALGSQKHVEEVPGVSEEIWQFLKKFCEPTLSCKITFIIIIITMIRIVICKESKQT